MSDVHNRPSVTLDRRQFVLGAGAVAGAALLGVGPTGRADDATSASPDVPNTPSPMNTRARIATICQPQVLKTVEQNRDYALERLDLAVKQGADLICLPETFPHKWTSGKFTELAEPLDGPTVSIVAERARKANAYVICPLATRREDRCYNTAVVIGRDGSILGMYDKNQLVTSSPDYTVLEDGMYPGNSVPVFDLDFGRIGIQICFDAGFPAAWQTLAEQDARIVFWPSAYAGGFPLQAYAGLHNYYVVSATGGTGARIINPLGRVVAGTDPLNHVIWRDINLDYAVCHTDFNYAIGDRIHDQYPGKVDVETDVPSGWFLVEPTDPSVTIAQLQEELGFETRRQYHARHDATYAALRQGAKPEPQTAAHGTRAQYSK